MHFLRDNGCVVNFNEGKLHAGNTHIKLKDESSLEVHRVCRPGRHCYHSAGSVPVRYYTHSDRPVAIYKDTSVGEFCPAVESGQTIPTARNSRVETTLDDSDKGTLNSNVLSFEAEPNSPYSQCPPLICANI